MALFLCVPTIAQQRRFMDNEFDLELELPKDVEETTPEHEEDDTVETVNEDETNQVETEDAAKQTETDFLKIKFNHEELGLTKEQAIELAQKGKNYDALNEKYNRLTNDPNLIELTRLANANGMSVNDYLKGLADIQQKADLDNAINDLKKQYPNADEALLTELAQSRLNATKQSQNDQKKQAEASRKAEINRQLDVFIKRYPDVNPQTLDRSVYSLMNENYTLLEAYEIVKAQERDSKQQAQNTQSIKEKQHMENKTRSMGNTSNQEGEDLSDSALFAKYMGF